MWKSLADGKVLTASTTGVQAPAVGVKPAAPADQRVSVVRSEPSARRTAALRRTLAIRKARRTALHARHSEAMGQQEEGARYWAVVSAIQAAEAAWIQVAQQAELAHQQSRRRRWARSSGRACRRAAGPPRARSGRDSWSARAVSCRVPRTPRGSWRGRPGPARAGIGAIPRGASRLSRR
jgi:hypothetical protein